jgi:hypothetical protein
MVKRLAIVLGSILAVIILTAIVLERIFGVGIFIKK